MFNINQVLINKLLKLFSLLVLIIYFYIDSIVLFGVRVKQKCNTHIEIPHLNSFNSN